MTTLGGVWDRSGPRAAEHLGEPREHGQVSVERYPVDSVNAEEREAVSGAYREEGGEEPDRVY